jgi:hypothetical protein
MKYISKVRRTELLWRASLAALRLQPHDKGERAQMEYTRGKSVILELPEETTIVLLDWVARFNESGVPAFEDPAEQAALWDLESTLEETVTSAFSPDRNILINARAKLREFYGL